MTSAGELLAHFCTAHGVRIGHIPGGKPNTTAQDILAICAKVWSEYESQLMFAKYCLDTRAQSRLWSYAFELTMSEKTLRGWTSKGPHSFERMSRVVVDDFCDAKKCARCQGTAHNMTEQGKIEACPRCEGTGLDFDSERRMASAMELGRTAYRNHWATRVDWLRRELVRAELGAEEKFQREWRRNRISAGDYVYYEKGNSLRRKEFRGQGKGL